MQAVDPDGPDEEEFVDDYVDEPSALSRFLWRAVWVLASVLLLAVVTMVSVAMLAPDAFTGACVRTQLVRPEECSPRLGNVRR